MNLRFPGALPSSLLFATAILLPAAIRAELRYSCEELGDMATRFQDLKASHYPLEDVLAVVQKSAKDNPDKEALLSNLAIEIYIDAEVDSTARARAVATSLCPPQLR
jgi:hypothetical protein